jgi:hypothetical protein
VDCGFKEFPAKYKNSKSKIRNPKYGKSPLGDLGVDFLQSWQVATRVNPVEALRYE